MDVKRGYEFRLVTPFFSNGRSVRMPEPSIRIFNWMNQSELGLREIEGLKVL